MITALIMKKPLEEALIWGTLNSASVVSFVGAQKGLLKESELNDWLVRGKDKVVVSEF